MPFYTDRYGFLLVWNGTHSVKLLTNIEKGGIKNGVKFAYWNLMMSKAPEDDQSNVGFIHDIYV